MNTREMTHRTMGRLALAEGADGIRLTTTRLRLTLPGSDLPAYTASRSGGGLRLVAEVFRTGTDTRAHRRTQTCERQADGTWLAELSLAPGEYDLRLWADWDDGYYDAGDLDKVVVLTTRPTARRTGRTPTTPRRP